MSMTNLSISMFVARELQAQLRPQPGAARANRELHQAMAHIRAVTQLARRHAIAAALLTLLRPGTAPAPAHLSLDPALGMHSHPACICSNIVSYATVCQYMLSYIAIFLPHARIC